MPLHVRPETRLLGVTSERVAPFGAPNAKSAAEGERGVENNSR
jgi:hypothetical protein